jgi:hypothetical protein
MFENPTPNITNMINAKQEFLKYVGDTVVCADIEYRPIWSDDTSKTFILKCGHTKEEFDQFLDSLDFEYDNGYGSQVLFGTVWFRDGSWMERGEYDGSEWWELRRRPEIPQELI